jgi:hypothetical protein
MALSTKGAKTTGYKAGLQVIKKLIEGDRINTPEAGEVDVGVLALETDIAADYLDQFGDDDEILDKVMEKFSDGVYAAIGDVNGFITRQQTSGSPLGGF